MSGKLIHSLDLAKESWENVSPIVFRSFQIVSTNMVNINKWTDRADVKFDKAAEHYQKTDSRLTALETKWKNSQEQIDGLSSHLDGLQQQSEKEFHAFTSSIKQLLDATLSFFERFVNAFDSENSSGLHHERLELDASGEHQDELQVLMVLCDHLGGHLDRITDAFNNWDTWRADSQEKNTFMLNKVSELQIASESSRERLLTWRELLKESRHEVEFLNAALRGTQKDVQEIQARQVIEEDVHDIVSERTQELERLRAITDERVEAVQKDLEEHVANVNDIVGDMDVSFRDEMANQGMEFTQTLERELNPINAYLNTMHVKIDTARVDLDRVCGQVPKLEASIDDTSAQLRLLDSEGQNRDVTLDARVDELTRASLESFERSDSERAALSESLHSLCRELGSRVTDLRTGLENTSQTVDAVRHVEISNLATSLVELERKVAKWVHASPLPQKISEARLYALEAQLNDEMQSRLHLEETVKDRSARGRHSKGLPSLDSRPRTQ